MSVSTLNAFYDFEVTPCSYDCIHFISLALGELENSNFDSLRFVFVPDENGELSGRGNPFYDEENHQWRFRQIVLPAFTSFAPGCEIVVCSNRQEAQSWLRREPNASIYPKGYSIENPVTRYFHGTFFQQPPPFFTRLSASSHAIALVEAWKRSHSSSGKLITITLRQCDYCLDRNSDLQSWISIVKALNGEGYHVVFVSDTDKALPQATALEEIEIFLPACFNLELRMALYQTSYLNLTINNGPSSLLYLSESSRFLYFKPISTSTHSANLYEMAARAKFRPGRHWPGNRSTQLFIWENDRPKTIERAFRLIVARIEGTETKSALPLIERANEAIEDSRPEDAWDWSALAVAFYPENQATWETRIRILLKTQREEEAFYQADEALARFESEAFCDLRLQGSAFLTNGYELYRLYADTLNNHPQLENRLRKYLGIPGGIVHPIASDHRNGVLVFGASLGGLNALAAIQSKATPILGFLDNDKSKTGQRINGYEVFAVEQLSAIAYKQIWIASQYSKDILLQLLRLGVPFSRIQLAPTEWLVDSNKV